MVIVASEGAESEWARFDEELEGEIEGTVLMLLLLLTLLTSVGDFKGGLIAPCIIFIEELWVSSIFIFFLGLEAIPVAFSAGFLEEFVLLLEDGRERFLGTINILPSS